MNASTSVSKPRTPFFSYLSRHLHTPTPSLCVPPQPRPLSFDSSLPSLRAPPFHFPCLRGPRPNFLRLFASIPTTPFPSDPYPALHFNPLPSLSVPTLSSLLSAPSPASALNLHRIVINWSLISRRLAFPDLLKPYTNPTWKLAAILYFQIVNNFHSVATNFADVDLFSSCFISLI